MPFADAASAVRARLVALWIETPIAHDNTQFDLPEPPIGFIHLSVRGGPASVASIGAPDRRLVRRHGSIRLVLFEPTGIGDQAARARADRLAALFEQARFSGVACGIAEIGAGEPFGRDGSWWQLPLRLPFHFDEVTT
jgi:hypothetical protein